ncbi:MAG: nucleotidyltransferase domain-containing protein [Candidatus Gastranaerophilales bacterium]|nr:nucleotidyltransferase domain-containing protein [Candidatus Gastranaerophilales bacterium]
MNISEIIKELNSKIKEKNLGFKGSYLYGSRAKGTYREDSDADVILVFDKELTRDEEVEIYDLLCDFDYKYNLIIMGLPYTMKELKKNYVFHDEVVNKGIYYDAA